MFVELSPYACSGLSTRKKTETNKICLFLYLFVCLTVCVFSLPPDAIVEENNNVVRECMVWYNC